MFSIACSKQVNIGIITRKNSRPQISSVYDVNEHIKTEESTKGGKVHRFAGPALTYYYDNGMVKEERWVQNGKIHRLSCPATTFYYENGMKRTENGIRTESYTVYRVLL